MVSPGTVADYQRQVLIVLAGLLPARWDASAGAPTAPSERRTWWIHTPRSPRGTPISPPLDLRAGDVTVHDALTVHSAPENETDSIRWVYSITWFPAETLYTGPSSSAWAPPDLGSA